MSLFVEGVEGKLSVGLAKDVEKNIKRMTDEQAKLVTDAYIRLVSILGRTFKNTCGHLLLVKKTAADIMREWAPLIKHPGLEKENTALFDELPLSSLGLSELKAKNLLTPGSTQAVWAYVKKVVANLEMPDEENEEEKDDDEAELKRMLESVTKEFPEDVQKQFAGFDRFEPGKKKLKQQPADIASNLLKQLSNLSEENIMAVGDAIYKMTRPGGLVQSIVQKVKDPKLQKTLFKKFVK